MGNGKRKRKNKETAPPPVKVSPVSLQRILGLQQEVERATHIRDSYVVGLKEGLGVPVSWLFNVKLGAFVPPEKRSG